MSLLVLYVLIALFFSFLCSIAEAVLLSVTVSHIALLESQDKSYAKVLYSLKNDINKPLSAILTLNTIAHTVGAAGAGAQAAVVFGDAAVGIASAILTFLILVFSEIIPKTIGAHYWRQLAPGVSYFLRGLIWALYPLVKMTEFLTRSFTQGPTLRGVNREELAALAEMGQHEGALAGKESTIMQNLLKLEQTPAKAAMTPRPVVFSVPQEVAIGDCFEQIKEATFSRIPTYSDNPENITGFVLRSDLLLAQACGQKQEQIGSFLRNIPKIPEQISLSRAFDRFLNERVHVMMVVDEYGGFSGILTLEDVLETLIGFEIVDEFDDNEDMQALARDLWAKRAKEMGIKVE